MLISSESLAPGVYVEEVTSLPQPLPCVSTSAAELMTLAARTSTHTGIPEFARFPPAIGTRPIGGLVPTGGLGPLRFFAAQGNQISGAPATRTLPGAQLSGVQSLTSKIVSSLQNGLQWAVFENNNSVLWGKVFNSIGSFLQGVEQRGGLQGHGTQAYFVQCGITTMTQADLAAGRLTVIVGFAPVRPAEYLVLQFIVQTKKK